MTAPLRPSQANLFTGPTERSGATPAGGIVVSPHFLASQAGIDILAASGNAVDAAIAVNAVLGVVLPDTCGPGGDLFALIHEPVKGPQSAVPAALNASGRAGSGMTAHAMRDAGFGAIPARSPWSITVPGCVDGWEALVDGYGTLPLERLLGRAIGLARSGFPVSDELAASLTSLHDAITDEGSAGPLYPEGAPPDPGVTITRPDIAETLEVVAEGGRAAFYQGAVGRAITDATHGAVTPDDLARSQAEWVTPLGATVFGRTAWTIPPNSQGYLTLAGLQIFEMLNPPDDPNDPLYQHLLIEAYRSIAWEREDTAVDAGHAPMTGEELLAEDRLAEFAGQVDRDRAGRWPMPRPAPHGTAYMTVWDTSGMGVSLIQSNFHGIGAGLSAGATGVFLQNRGAAFNLIPGHVNEYAPGKRPLHTLSPMLWTAGADLDLLLGTRGGDQQPQYLGQYAASVYHAGNCTDDSQTLPRWMMDQPLAGTDSALRFESRVAPATVRGLEDRGHTVTLAESHEPGWGPISAIDTSREKKGSADPRISTSAALTT